LHGFSPINWMWNKRVLAGGDESGSRRHLGPHCRWTNRHHQTLPQGSCPQPLLLSSVNWNRYSGCGDRRYWNCAKLWFVKLDPSHWNCVKLSCLDCLVATLSTVHFMHTAEIRSHCRHTRNKKPRMLSQSEPTVGGRHAIDVDKWT
jgi:hypothetical protein